MAKKGIPVFVSKSRDVYQAGRVALKRKSDPQINIRLQLVASSRIPGTTNVEIRMTDKYGNEAEESWTAEGVRVLARTLMEAADYAEFGEYILDEAI